MHTVPEERRNELFARLVVAQALGCVVERFEDGSRDSQVDAQILHPHGAAGLEIVADIDPEQSSMWGALDAVGHEVYVDGLTRRWIVSLRRSASVKKAVAAIPALMLSLERGDLHLQRARVPAALDAIGVKSVYPITGDDRAGGRVHLKMEGWGGSAGREELTPWLSQMFERHDDVRRKLAAHPTADGHAFFWVTSGSDFSAQFALENRGQDLPTLVPELPRGVTHVWVGGLSSSQGVLAWFPDCGWWRTPWVWPAKEDLPLG